MMNEGIEQIKARILELDMKDRMALFKWCSTCRREEVSWQHDEMVRVWKYMRESILTVDPDIDIASRDRRRKVVIYRAHIMNHVYSDWIYGISYKTIGEIAGLTHPTVRNAIVQSRNYLDTNRNNPAWKDVHSANDIVLRIYDNYIKQ